jgi:hypothetical protein
MVSLPQEKSWLGQVSPRLGEILWTTGINQGTFLLPNESPEAFLKIL